ncbi:cytosine-purine permease, partial [Cyathus striatus]
MTDHDSKALVEITDQDSENAPFEHSLPVLTSDTKEQSYRSRFSRLSIESRGIQPVSTEQRTDEQYSKLFFIWFTSNVNILSFSSGTLGPVVYGLGVRDSCLTILFFNLLCCIPGAYFAIWGPKLGMRQMIISRYSFGYFGIMLPCLLNLIGLCGFSILNCILGGQALASITNGRLSWTVGIIITALISLLVSFCGYKVLHWYQRVAWIPVLTTFIIALGVGGKHLSSPPPPEPATASAVLSFGSTIAAALAWAPASADFGTYLKHDVSGPKIFWYSYLGLLTPLVLLQSFGAVVAASAPSVPSWAEGYTGGNVGGLLEAMLRPTGNFGKFLTVLLSLSVAPNITATFYSFSFDIQVFIPALVVVPRYVFSIIATAIVVPLAIAGAHRFYDAIVNFLGLLGYWTSPYVAIILIEHFIFRRADYSAYDISIWNAPRKLPSGLAAVGAGLAGFGVAVACMDQVWFQGPIAKTAGDIGFEVAFAVSAVVYPPLRALERRWMSRR